MYGRLSSARGEEENLIYQGLESNEQSFRPYKARTLEQLQATNRLVR
jgi:hypothetical protein